mmetsp:Transcript_6970/g.10508  ORF Transcript_6970/g.10508 Transcript_6970/m.10508 type:complete len:98 (-) Transcript_6970:20-313(-)
MARLSPSLWTLMLNLQPLPSVCKQMKAYYMFYAELVCSFVNLAPERGLIGAHCILTLCIFLGCRTEMATLYLLYVVVFFLCPLPCVFSVQRGLSNMG